MTDLFREVEEDVRREQMKKVWNRYGSWFMGACALIVIGVGGFRAFEWYQDRQAQQASAGYFSAISAAENDPAGAIDRLAELADGSTGFAQLARLRAAAALAESGDVTTAIRSFEAIAQDNSVDALVRDLATIRAGYMQIERDSYDVLQGRLEPLTTGTQAFRHSAREILGLSAFRAGAIEEAARWFTMLEEDAGTPRDMSARVQLMQALITPRLERTSTGEALPSGEGNEASQ